MRIRGVRIGSFGAMRDRTFSVGEGMTVFHGPNESGKTTLMEFIRTSLVPSNKRNQYPARERTDSGTLVYEQDGAERTIRLVQKSVEGERPSMPVGTDDPALFRSVFAMTSSDLDDEKVVTEGGIRSRFLTVPGGEAMPAAREAADEMRDANLGKRSNSRSRAISLDAEISDMDDRIAQARSLTDSYGELDRRRSELSSKLAELESSSESLRETKRVHDVYQSNVGNYGRLRELGECRRDLGEFVTVTSEDEDEMAKLRSEAEQKKTALQELLDRRREEERDLMGADRRRVSAHSKAIESMPGRLHTYREDSRRLRELEARRDAIRSQTPPEPVRDSGTGRRGSTALLVAGLAIIVLGIAAALLTEPYAIVVSVAGAAVAAVGLLRPKPAAPVPKPVVDDSLDREVDAIRERMSHFENEVLSVMSDLEMDSFGIEDDVAFLSKARDAAAALSKTENDILRARMEQGSASNSLLTFAQRFSGEEGYARCLQRTREAERIDREVAVIRDALTKAGLDPDVPECPVSYEGDAVSSEIGDVRQEIGVLEERMRSILDTVELERMMDRRAQLQSELAEALDDGAVGLLAAAIADSACQEIYSRVQPGVIATADRYLSMMTDGRYRIDTDPRSKDLAVRSGDEVKGIGAWSSGLRAQVLLSVKLAVAREMGRGEVPVILDDVLLPFDSERKAGACRALAELSSEMQVLMFTCDAETVRICSGLEGVSVVPMTSA